MSPVLIREMPKRYWRGSEHLTANEEGPVGTGPSDAQKLLSPYFFPLAGGADAMGALAPALGGVAPALLVSAPAIGVGFLAFGSTAMDALAPALGGAAPALCW